MWPNRMMSSFFPKLLRHQNLTSLPFSQLQRQKLHSQHMLYSLSLVRGEFTIGQGMCNGRHQFNKYILQSLHFRRYFIRRAHSKGSGKINEEFFDANKSGSEEGTGIVTDPAPRGLLGPDPLMDTWKNAKSLSQGEWMDIRVKLTELGEKGCLEVAQSRQQKFVPTVYIFSQCKSFLNYSLATSYFEFLASKDETNASSLSLYLEVCASCVETCGENRVLEVYHMLKKYAQIFPTTLASRAMHSLCQTSHWKVALNDLPDVTINSEQFNSYSSFIAAAFRDGDSDAGWYLLEKQLLHRLPSDEAWVAVIDWLQRLDGTEVKSKNLSRLFNIFHDYSVYPQMQVANSLFNFLSDHLDLSVTRCRMKRTSSQCPSCGDLLPRNSISEENFEKLRDEFESRVVYGADIYHTSNPEEWERFRDFIRANGPFSAVVDSLNIIYANTKGRKDKLLQLFQVLEQLNKFESPHPVLVIGRSHMKYLKDFDLLRQRASLFTSKNVSKDDCFMVYAALQSGLGTKFVTNDFLRDHTFQLKEEFLKKLFKNWVDSHQISFKLNRGRIWLKVKGQDLSC